MLTAAVVVALSQTACHRDDGDEGRTATDREAGVTFVVKGDTVTVEFAERAAPIARRVRTVVCVETGPGLTTTAAALRVRPDERVATVDTGPRGPDEVGQLEERVSSCLLEAADGEDLVEAEFRQP